MRPSSSTASRHVLLIDGERYVWDVVRHALGDGYRISAVAFRSAALRLLDKDPPDVIVVDLTLNALALPLAIHSLRRHIPVVMTTSNHHLARRLMRLGCVIVRKPYLPSELRQCVAGAVADPDDNLLRHRGALERIQSDGREREAILRLVGNMRDQVLLALKSGAISGR